MSHTWSATYTPMSNDSGRLQVSGEYNSIGGSTVTLEKQNPQGINPTILILKEVETTPTGIAHSNVDRIIPVTYEETTNLFYSEVEVLPAGVKIKVKHLKT